ncbi:ABC transporter permease [Ruminococcaceae bacterium OttesenSCG-928-D13]|nr:ABC transporter permease [Ruminococcaceae bacterium OttesenSCG-928-D13]
MNHLTKVQRKRRALRVLGDVYAVLIYTVLYIPVAVMMIFSFNNQRYNYYWNGFTTQWYEKLFNNSAIIDSLWYSVIIAVLSTVISVVVGTLGALGLKRYEFRGKKLVNSMLYIPIIVPEIVLAVALLIIFMTFGFSLGMGSILIGHCTFCIPYAVVTIKGRISGDGNSLEEASMDLGANRMQTFFRVTLPSIMPGVMSAAFLAFTLSIDDVVMSNMLAGAKNSTLPVLILSMNKSGITPDVNALTTLMILAIVAAMLLSGGVKALLARRAKRLEAE